MCFDLFEVPLPSLAVRVESCKIRHADFTWIDRIVVLEARFCWVSGVRVVFVHLIFIQYWKLSESKPHNRDFQCLIPQKLKIKNLQSQFSIFVAKKGKIKHHYYSFKIFPRFWLAKSTRLIHHNQLLMTKFGRILCLTRKWHQKCSVFAG